jgi:hypothetical protein
MRKGLAAIVLLLAAACSAKLETGYQPKPLNMTLTERKTLYADPFSNEAAKAEQDKANSGPSMGH